MEEKLYTTGEIAKASGLTNRTIQHYDNIGLLPSTGRTEGGRRYYTHNDLINLEQIVFYKTLGFSLEQIKEHLLLYPSTEDLLEMFKDQQLLLLQRIEQLHTSFATIDIMSKVVEQGNKPPIHILFHFLNALPGDDIFAHAPQLLTKEQNDILSPYFGDLETIQNFYHRWKEISIEGAVLQDADIPPDDQMAQSLAKRWLDTIFDLTGGNKELLDQLSNMGINYQFLSKNKEIMESIENYIQKACDIYVANNNFLFEDKNDREESR
ncbi:MAG: MerR family transcriptional regulator [Dysgonamonadaceae bacterium]|nr:MerR family transcriptional regulator [Dysgonamonadaceae bacterium]